MWRAAPGAVAAAARLRDAGARRVEGSPRGGAMVLAVVAGLGSGLGAVGFEALIDACDWFFFDVVKDRWLDPLGGWRLILIPALGGLLVGPLTQRLAPRRGATACPRCWSRWRPRAGASAPA